MANDTTKYNDDNRSTLQAVTSGGDIKNLKVNSSGHLVVSQASYADDVALTLGTGDDASLIWETADANANAMLISLPAGDATNVPVLVIGDDTALNADLGLFDGITDPSIAVLSDDATKAMRLSHNGTSSLITSTSGAVALGAQITSHSVTSTDSLIVYDLEVNNTIWADSWIAPAIGFGFIFGGSISPYGGIAHVLSVGFSWGVGNDATNGKRVIQLVDGANYNNNYSHALQSNPTLFGHSVTAAATATDEWWSLTHDTTDTVFGHGKGDLRIDYDGENNCKTNVRVAETELTSVSGASVTASSLIPDGAFLLGVTTRITTALGTTNGTTGYNVGDGSDADRFGVASAVTLGTTTDNTSATAAFTGSFTSANDVVLTAVGGNFDGTGDIRVIAHYIDLTAPTS